MTIPGIIRPIKSNEELSVSKYILSTYYPAPASFKCHLWSAGVFVSNEAQNFFAVLLQSP